MRVQGVAWAVLVAALASGCSRPGPKPIDNRSPEQRQRDEATQKQILQRRSAASGHQHAGARKPER